MLNNQGFDLWADGYDQSVGLSDEQGAYPFGGYRRVLNTIYNAVLSSGQKSVLDIGFGTGVLTARLYEQGCAICGQDFSPRMIELAQPKMPEAALYCGDFTQGLVPELAVRKYDAIIATYSLHHLDDGQKVDFLRALRSHLNKGGCVYIGDVAFPTRADLEACRAAAGHDWDEEEIYFVYDELRKTLPELRFEPISSCAGVLTLAADTKE